MDILLLLICGAVLLFLSTEIEDEHTSRASLAVGLFFWWAAIMNSFLFRLMQTLREVLS